MHAYKLWVIKPKFKKTKLFQFGSDYEHTKILIKYVQKCQKNIQKHPKKSKKSKYVKNLSKCIQMCWNVSKDVSKCIKICQKSKLSEGPQEQEQQRDGNIVTFRTSRQSWWSKKIRKVSVQWEIVGTMLFLGSHGYVN